MSKPGLRTLASDRFRLVVALLIATAGVALNAVFLVALDGAVPDWDQDFLAYYLAAGRLADGLPLYEQAQLSGPIDAVCYDCYLYPPPFAQLLSPLSGLGFGDAQVFWYVVQSAVMVGAIWLATGVGGAARSLERLAWCVVAVTWFMPVFASLWYGNVSTLLALTVVLVAMGGAAAGVGGGLATVLKVVPLVYLPAVLMMGRRAIGSLIATLLVVVGVSFILDPASWFDFPQALANLVTGSSDSLDNYAPASLVEAAGWPSAAATGIRLLTLGIVAATLVTSVWAARRPGGAPLAALLATISMLLLPGTLWYHYLAVLLPLAAMAWPRGRMGARTALLAGAVAVIAAGVTQPWLAIVGGGGMLAAAAWALWPAFGPSADGADLANRRSAAD